MGIVFLSKLFCGSSFIPATARFGFMFPGSGLVYVGLDSYVVLPLFGIYTGTVRLRGAAEVAVIGKGSSFKGVCNVAEWTGREEHHLMTYCTTYTTCLV